MHLFRLKKQTTENVADTTFKCRLEEHMKMHKQAEVQVCSVCKKQFRRNNFVLLNIKMSVTSTKIKIITCVGHNETKK